MGFFVLEDIFLSELREWGVVELSFCFLLEVLAATFQPGPPEWSFSLLLLNADPTSLSYFAGSLSKLIPL